jgi:hypothetical protein
VDVRPSRPALIVLGIVFALLWLPLGQLSYLYAEWPKMALGGGVATLFALAVLVSRYDVAPRSVLLLVLACYLIHQFEEHGVDLLGQEFAFEGAINGILGPVVGCQSDVLCPFDPQTLYLVNTTLVWWLIASVIAAGAGAPVAALMAIAIMTVNAWTHIVGAVVLQAYNPGLATAIVVFLPVGIGATVWFARRYAVPRRTVILTVLYGVALHLLLAAGIFGVFAGWYGPGFYGLILFLAATPPMLLTLRAARPRG